ncbi:MAG: putative photosynthetic complex assembly protein PuhE [Pseudomonadota bacterium]
MVDFGLPLLFALFVWWFSTGAILVVISWPQATHRWSLAIATVLAIMAFHGVLVSRDEPTVAGAYAAFTAGIVLWGWHELAFLTGIMAGPRRTPLTPGTTGWRRFREATATILYHELAIFLTAAALFAATVSSPNQVAMWTFVVLWLMRLSAKLNVFWGVPNLNEEFLPPQLDFLKSYFRKAPLNAFFPLSVTAATVVAGAMVVHAVALDPGPFGTAGLALVGTLLALAVLEHWFLVLPIPDAALWRWALKPDPAAAADEATGLPPLLPGQALTTTAGSIGVDPRHGDLGSPGLASRIKPLQ